MPLQELNELADLEKNHFAVTCNCQSVYSVCAALYAILEAGSLSMEGKVLLSVIMPDLIIVKGCKTPREWGT